MENNIILLILIIIICVILIFCYKEKFNDYTNPSSQNGDCKSLTTNIENNYPNYKSMTFVDDLNNRCKLECDNEPLCKGYSINNELQENNCKLYGSIYNDTQGNYNNLDLDNTGTNDNSGWTCKIKKFKNQFRYYKLVINNIRSKLLENRNYLVQISEIKFYDINKNPINISSADVLVTNPPAINKPTEPKKPERMSCGFMIGNKKRECQDKINKYNQDFAEYTRLLDIFNKNNPRGEEPNKIKDGDNNTKWLDFSSTFTPGKSSVLLFDFGENYNKNYERIMYYDFITGNDYVNRDPKAWTFYGSDDNKKWYLLNNQIDQTNDNNTSRNSSISQGKLYKFKYPYTPCGDCPTCQCTSEPLSNCSNPQTELLKNKLKNTTEDLVKIIDYYTSINNKLKNTPQNINRTSSTITTSTSGTPKPTNLNRFNTELGQDNNNNDINYSILFINQLVNEIDKLLIEINGNIVNYQTNYSTFKTELDKNIKNKNESVEKLKKNLGFKIQNSVSTESFGDINNKLIESQIKIEKKKLPMIPNMKGNIIISQ